MNKNEEWNDFLSNLALNGVGDNKTTMEKEYKQQRQEHIDEMLGTILMENERLFVEEIIVELGLLGEREMEMSYKQGLNDCVWILKNLSVLA